MTAPSSPASAGLLSPHASAPAPGLELLVASGIAVTAGGEPILENVSLSLAGREIVVLIGPNGSGKTTLLRSLLGLQPHAGEVSRKPALKIGYVPQNFARDPSLPLTVARLVALTHRPDRARVRAALDRLSIAHLADKQVHSLSGGELKRALLARAIAQAPELLLLDEPLAGVDLAGEAALYHLIADLRDELGCGVLLVSHDLHVVMAQADRVICLNRHICCEGAAGQVIRDPEFARLFGARVASELALYAHHHDHAHTPTGAVLHDPGDEHPGDEHHGDEHHHG